MNDKKILVSYYIEKNLDLENIGKNDINITKFSLLFYGIEEKKYR